MKRPSRVRLTILAVVALVILALLLGPFLVPVGPAKDTLPPQLLAEPDSRFVELGEIVGTARLSVHYKDSGDRDPPLVLFHGFGGSTFSWREVLPELARSHRVVAFDRPGFGLTARPLPGEWQGMSPYSAPAQIALTLGLLDRLGLDQAVLVGHSAGGAVALEVALAHPERVLALVLVAPAVSGEGPPSWLQPFLKLPQIRHLGPLLVRRLVGSLERLLEQSYADPSFLTPAVREGYKKPLRADNWDRGLWEIIVAAKPGDLSEKLSEIAAPTLVISGDSDRVVSPKDSARVAALMPNASFVAVTGAGHLVMEEKPASLLAELERFLAAINAMQLHRPATPTERSGP